MRKRTVNQWQVYGQPVDDKTRVWTEVQLDVNELVELLGLAGGTRLISMSIDRSHTTMTWTFEKPREAACPAVPFASESSAGPASG